MLLRSIAVVVLGFLASSSFAGSIQNAHPFYLRAQAGLMRQHLTEDKLRGNLATDVAKLSEEKNTDLAGRVAAGIKLTDSVALEAGYLKATNSKFDVKQLSNGIKVDEVTSKVDVIDVIAKAFVPVADNVALFASGGLAYTMVNNDDNGNLLASYHHDENAFRPELGAGLAVNVAPNMTLDASYTQIFGKGSTRVGSDYLPDLKMYALGVSYAF